MLVTRFRIWAFLSVLLISQSFFLASNARGAAAFVQATARAATVASKSLSLSFPANTVAGDIVLVAFDFDLNSVPSSVTDSQGNVFYPVGNQLTTPGGSRSRVYYAKNIKGGADTVTVNLSANSGWIELYLSEYKGVDQMNPIDAQAGASGKAGSVSSGNATTTMTGDVIYAYCVGDWVCTAGSGFAAHSTLNGNLIEDKLAGTAGTYVATGSANNGWSIQMVALKPASSGIGAPPVVTSATTASGKMGTAFSYQISATNTPTSYGATGLPAALSVNSTTGLISGTPTSTGTSTVALSATNSKGTGHATLTLTVPVAQPVVTSATTASGKVGTAFSYQISATNTPTSYGATGLPAGLSVNGSTGLISGTPTATGSSTVTLSATNSKGTGYTTLTLSITSNSVRSQFIALSANRKYLVNPSTGQPVFLLGDAPQGIAEMLDSAQVTEYLNDRAGRGINALWITVTDLYQTSPPYNYYGYKPFDGADFTNEDENYFANVDSVVNQAGSLGMTVFLMPMFVGNGSEPGYLSNVLSASSPTLTAYGTYLGKRYASFPNIVWLLGGDSFPSTSGLFSQLNTLGAAIHAADPNHLMTLEACEHCVPNGYNSVQGFQAASLTVPSWLTLNWAYPASSDTVAACNAAYNQSPFLPPLVGEDYYELENSTTPAILRFEGYSEILSGCNVGRFFGNGAIWGFSSRNGSTCCTSGTPAWQSELSSTGIQQQTILGKLFRSREHWLLVPDIKHTVVTAGYGSGLTVTTTARTSDGQTIISYIPNGGATTITVDMTKITSATSTVRGCWFDPQTGATQNLGIFSNSGTQNFRPPDSNDWVLVLDDANANLPAP